MQRVQTFLTPRRALILAVLGVLLLQAMFWIPAARTPGFASSDAGVKVWQTQSVLRTGRLDAPIDYAGAVYDAAHLYSPFVPPWFFWQDGQPYSEYVSPFIWLSAPLYAALGHKGLLLLPGLSGALLIILAAWLMWRVRRDYWAVLAPLIVGLSSPLLIYSIEFWEHTPGAALAAVALVGIVKALDSRRRGLWLIASGAAVGFSLTMRAELYLYPLAIVLGLVLLRKQLPILRSIVFLAMGGLLTAGPWWVYQAVRWGNPLGPRVAQNVPGLGGADMLRRLGDTTGRNWTMVWPGGGSGVEWLNVLGAAVIGLIVLALVLRRTRLGRVCFWLATLAIAALAAILTWRLIHWQSEIALRPDDLLTTFPAALLVLLLLSSYFARRPAEAPATSRAVVNFLFVVAAAFLVLVVLVSPFQGGVQWGPRFLLPIIVPLSVVLVEAVAQTWMQFDLLPFKHARRLGLVVVLVVVLGVGSYSTYLGAQFIRAGQNGNAEFQQMIEAAPERVVVTDAWFIPQGAAYAFGNKIWLMAEDEKKMFQLLQDLRKQTNEPGMIYLSSLTWAHIDPQILMGPRIAPNGDSHDFDWPGMYLRLARYFLYK